MIGYGTEQLVAGGLFSKAGKMSLEKFPMLQNPEALLNGRMHQKSQFDVNPKTIFDEEQQDLKKKRIDKRLFPQTTTHKKSIPRDRQPFGKITSRAQCELVQSKETSNSQIFGMYNPKYHFLYAGPLYEDKDFVNQNRERYREIAKLKMFNSNKNLLGHLKLNSLNQSSSVNALSTKRAINRRELARHQQSSVSNELSLPQLYYGLDFDKPKKKVVGPIEFGKQVKKSLFL